MHTKEGIFNLALGMLLLSRQITNTATDRSNENTVLNIHYQTAFNSTLEDLDLDSCSTQGALSLIEEGPFDTTELDGAWRYSYAYPSDCAFFRRIQSRSVVDNRTSHIPRRITIIDGQKVILTNEQDAIGEWISTNTPLSTMSATVGLAIACRLAILSAPLITGKGAQALLKALEEKYIVLKAEASEMGHRENFSFVDERIESEFVNARLE